MVTNMTEKINKKILYSLASTLKKLKEKVIYRRFF